jgi:hypothetical protein
MSSFLSEAAAPPLYSNAAGDVWLAPPLIAVVPADSVWLGSQELHYAAIGDRSYSYLADAGGLGPDDAFLAYSNAIAGAFGQVAAASPHWGSAVILRIRACPG